MPISEINRLLSELSDWYNSYDFNDVSEDNKKQIITSKFVELGIFNIDFGKMDYFNNKLSSKASDFISLNTNYLNNINKSTVKDIMFSYDKEIIILLYDGILMVNGEVVGNNVNRLFRQDAIMIYSISNDNEIMLVTQISTKLSKYINNNYKYKKIVTSVLSLTALTYDGKVRAITPCLSVGILPERFINVDDIVYIVNEEKEWDDDILVKQDGKYWPLFVNDNNL